MSNKSIKKFLLPNRINVMVWGELRILKRGAEPVQCHGCREVMSFCSSPSYAWNWEYMSQTTQLVRQDYLAWGESLRDLKWPGKDIHVYEPKKMPHWPWMRRVNHAISLRDSSVWHLISKMVRERDSCLWTQVDTTLALDEMHESLPLKSIFSWFKFLTFDI